MVLEYLPSCHSLVVSNRHSLVLFTCLFVSSLPVPFPLIFVLICLISNHACLRLRFQPNLESICSAVMSFCQKNSCPNSKYFSVDFSQKNITVASSSENSDFISTNAHKSQVSSAELSALDTGCLVFLYSFLHYPRLSSLHHFYHMILCFPRLFPVSLFATVISRPLGSS